MTNKDLNYSDIVSIGVNPPLSRRKIGIARND